MAWMQPVCFRFVERLEKASVLIEQMFRTLVSLSAGWAPCKNSLSWGIRSHVLDQFWFCLACLACGVFVSATGKVGECSQADAPEDPQRQLVEFVIAGIKDRIDKISSGEVVVTLLRSPDLGLTDDRSGWIKDSDYRLVFDYRSGNILFEHQVHSSGSGTRIFKTLQTSDSNYFYEQPRQDAGIVVLRSNNETSQIMEALPIDFRVAGIVGWGEVRSQYTFDKCKQEYWLNPALFQEVAAVRNGSEGLTELKLVHTDSTGGEWKIVAKIDEERQYVPVEVSRYFLPANTLGTAASNSPKPSSTIITSWEEVSGIWVPEKWTITRGLEPPVMFSFEWKRLNCEFDSKEFSIEGMDLPDGTMMVNSLGATPIVEGEIGEEAELITKDVVNTNNGSKRHTTRLLFLCNTGVITALIVLYGYRRLRQRSA